MGHSLHRILEEIKEEQKAIRIMIINMAAKIGPEKDECLCPEEISLPVHDDVEDVDRVEHLLQDKSVAKLLVDHLSTIGGGSLKIMTKRILKRSITSTLATNYNWTGAKGKSAFQSLRIAVIILRAVRHNFPQHPHSETELSSKTGSEMLRIVTVAE